MADIFHLIGLVVPGEEAVMKGPAAIGVNAQLMRKGTITSSTRRMKESRAKSEWRKNRFRTNGISIKNFEREDWDAIYDFEDEFSRRGNFRCKLR